jgi:hypothetical protein
MVTLRTEPMDMRYMWASQALQHRARRLAELAARALSRRDEDFALDQFDEAEAIGEKMLRIIKEAREERRRFIATIPG